MRDMKYGKCYTNLYMGKVVWSTFGTRTLKLRELKQTTSHFEKNAYSQMNVAPAIQVLSATAALLIFRALDANDIVIWAQNKGVYN